MSQDDKLEEFTRQLQAQILERIKKRYPPAVIDHWQNPRHFFRMEHPDGYARVKGSCGDTMEMFVRMKGEMIAECAFQTDGCGTTIACGSMAAELTGGKTFTQALAGVSSQEILKHLGGLPPEDVHCAQLAAESLRRALADALYQKGAPWKKHYRKT